MRRGGVVVPRGPFFRGAQVLVAAGMLVVGSQPLIGLSGAPLPAAKAQLADNLDCPAVDGVLDDLEAPRGAVRVAQSAQRIAQRATTAAGD